MSVVINMEFSERKPNRLPEYDYGQVGSYFVTVCTHSRVRLFRMEPSVGNGLRAVPQEQINLSAGNQIIHKWIAEMESKFSNLSVDKYVIMPDHLHMIVTIQVQSEGCTLPDAMRFFKTMTTNEYIRGVKSGILLPFDQRIPS